MEIDCTAKNTQASQGGAADTLLLAAAFLMLFWGLGERALWGSEGRWAEIAREMNLSKDYFHPTIGGQPYFDKPLLTYWLIVAVSAVTTRLNEWVCRLPSALAGLAAVWATVSIGRRLWSPQVGRIAGWIMLTTYGVLLWSRTAAADTENLAAIMLCVAWYYANREHLGFRFFTLLYIIVVLGTLTKGLTAVVIPAAVILPDIIQNGRWKALLRPSHFAALVIGIILYLAPFVYASAAAQGYHASGLGLVFKENIQRFFAPFDHKEPFYVYFYHTPTLFLPWSVLLILALIAVVPRWKQIDENTKWLLKAMALIFLIFTASGSRRNYYILPIVPFCAMLTAVFLVYIKDEKTEALKKLGLDIQQVVLGVMIVLELAAPFIFKVVQAKKGIEPPPGFFAASIVIGIAAIVVWIFVLRVKKESRINALVGVTAVLMGGFYCWQLNTFEFYRSTEKTFISQLKTQTADISPAQVGFFTSNNRSSAETLFYLDKPGLSTIINDANGLKCFLAGEPPRVLIAARKGLPAGLEEQLAKCQVIAEESQKWEDKKEQGKKRIAWILKEPVMVEMKQTGRTEKISNEE